MRCAPGPCPARIEDGGDPHGRYRAKSSVLEPNLDVLERYGDAGAYTVTESREIETRGLEETLRVHGVENLDLLKLDVQGFELFLLSRSFANYAGRRWQPYGKGQIQFADAAYIRTRTEDLSPVELGKLIILASYYGFADYGFFLHRENERRIAELGEPCSRSF